MNPASRAALLAFVAPLVGACEQGQGFLRGDFLAVPDCQGVDRPVRFEPFEMDLAHLGVDIEGRAAIVHMSPSAKEIDEADQVALTIADSRALMARLREGEVTLSLRGDGSGEAELGFVLLGRCAEATAPIVAEGTVTFSRFGERTGEHVTGSLAFDAVDRRTGEVVGRAFVGDFDFRAGRYSPFTFYADREY
jgi:hypothetical protein